MNLSVKLKFFSLLLVSLFLLNSNLAGAAPSCHELFQENQLTDLQRIRDGSFYSREHYYRILKRALRSTTPEHFASWFYSKEGELNPGLEYLDIAKEIKSDLADLIIYPGLIQRREQFFIFLTSLSRAEVVNSTSQQLYDMFSKQLGFKTFYRGISVSGASIETSEGLQRYKEFLQSKKLLKDLAAKHLQRTLNSPWREEQGLPQIESYYFQFSKEYEKLPPNWSLQMNPIAHEISNHVVGDGHASSTILSVTTERGLAEAMAGNYLRNTSTAKIDAGLLFTLRIPVIETLWTGKYGLFGRENHLNNGFIIHEISSERDADGRISQTRVRDIVYPSLYESEGQIETLIPWQISPSEVVQIEVILRDFKHVDDRKPVYSFEYK